MPVYNVFLFSSVAMCHGFTYFVFSWKNKKIHVLWVDIDPDRLDPDTRALDTSRFVSGTGKIMRIWPDPDPQHWFYFELHAFEAFE